MLVEGINYWLRDLGCLLIVNELTSFIIPFKQILEEREMVETNRDSTICH